MTNEFQIVRTAAEAALGEDMLKDEKFNRTNYSRWLSSIAVVGSTNIGDCGFELFSGERRIGTFYNTAGGANLIPDDSDRKYPKSIVRASEGLSLICIDAAAGNNVVFELKFDSYKTPKRFNKNYSWGSQNRGSFRPRYNRTAYRRY